MIQDPFRKATIDEQIAETNTKIQMISDKLSNLPSFGEKDCTYCQGTGKIGIIFKSDCFVCHGTGKVEDTESRINYTSYLFRDLNELQTKKIELMFKKWGKDL